MDKTLAKSIYDYKIKSLNSKEVIDLADYRGKMMLMVNVASRCGFTKQYQDLQRLFETYQDQLVVIGFPSNQFLFQEPGSEEKIESFCKSNYGVSFPMTTKIKVRGSKKHPIYNWLTDISLNGVNDTGVSWNFNKFLIDRNGHLVGHFKSTVEPFDHRIIDRLNRKYAE